MIQLPQSYLCKLFFTTRQRLWQVKIPSAGCKYKRRFFNIDKNVNKVL
jgi:hypothetical protein